MAVEPVGRVILTGQIRKLRLREGQSLPRVGQRVNVNLTDTEVRFFSSSWDTEDISSPSVPLQCPRLLLATLTIGLYITSLISGLPLYTIGIIIVFIWWGCCEYLIDTHSIHSTVAGTQ